MGNIEVYFYTMKIRSILEYAAPVFTSMLTQKNISDIERIQKTVLKVLLQEDYISYTNACNIMMTTSLEQRRENLSLKFALSCLSNPKHTHLFKQRQSQFYNIRNIRSYEEPYCTSKRHYSSPIPYLTRLLNEHFKKSKSRKVIK